MLVSHFHSLYTLFTNSNMETAMWKVLMSIVMVGMLAGCATQRQMTRAEYLNTTQRVYQGKTPDDIFGAAEKLFRLADGNDFHIAYTDDTMMASRQWTVYLVLAASMGTDSWVIRTKQVNGGTKVSALVSTVAGAIAPMATTGGDWTATGVPGGGSLVQGNAIYDVFWARMNYLLGKSNHWMTCKEADDRVRAGKTWGTNEALCNSFNMKDKSPSGITASS